MATRILFGNGGQIILQLKNWAHSYGDEGGSHDYWSKQVADDVAEWLRTGSVDDWEGHDRDAMAVEPDEETDVVLIDRRDDTIASLAEEIADTEGAAAIGVANALASSLLGEAADPTITQPSAIRFEDGQWFAVYAPANGVEDVPYNSLASLLRAHSLVLSATKVGAE